MNIKVEQSSLPQGGNIPVILPSGDLDMHESPKLRDILASEIAKKPKGLIVNLSAIEFIDSSGVATLIEAMKGLQDIHARLVLCGMSQKILDVFQLARLDKFFVIKTTSEDALSFVAGG